MTHPHANDADEAHVPSSFSFPCPDCGKQLKAKSDMVGKKVKCPSCGNSLLVPAADTGGLTAQERGSGRMRKTWLLAGVALAAILLVCGWFFLQQRPETRSFLNIALGNEVVEGVEEAGFYNQEEFEGKPFRWTNGRGRLVIPLDKSKPPQELVVELRIYRPPEVRDIPLRITANQRELFKQRVAGSKWEKTFDLSTTELGTELVLEIVSDTFTPKGVMEGGANQDSRTLGVQVWQVKLLRDEAAK